MRTNQQFRRIPQVSPKEMRLDQLNKWIEQAADLADALLQDSNPALKVLGGHAQEIMVALGTESEMIIRENGPFVTFPNGIPFGRAA